MALKLDDNLLTEIGLGLLPASEKSKMLKHIYETLEMRVGVKLAERMSDQQLDEFESFINSGDEAGALRWLETTFPDYKDVVRQEFESLKDEIRQVAPQIVAEASQAQEQQIHGADESMQQPGVQGPQGYGVPQQQDHHVPPTQADPAMPPQQQQPPQYPDHHYPQSPPQQ